MIIITSSKFLLMLLWMFLEDMLLSSAPGGACAGPRLFGTSCAVASGVVTGWGRMLLPAAVGCDMASHRAFHARSVRKQRHRRLGATWCYIARSVRDIFKREM